MKVLKKIGLGFISLGLISTFNISEAKANLTLFEYTYPDSHPVHGGRTYALKLLTSRLNVGKYRMKRVGSGNNFCTMWISNPSQLATFQSCVARNLGDDILTPLIEARVAPELLK